MKDYIEENINEKEFINKLEYFIKNIGNEIDENFANMIYWILEHTDCSVALIPHVVWEDNDDRTALKQIHEKFKDNNRDLMKDDTNCKQ